MNCWFIRPTMLLVKVSFLLVLVHYGKGETGDAYHGPPQARELFSYNDKFFYFYSDKCSYEEAAAICEAGNMHLATLDDPGKAKFAAESIAEAWMVFEDMWIGAKKGDMGKWNWTWTGKRLPDEPQMIGNHTFMYPPWVDNQIPARDGKDCLAVDRNGHNDPYFVDLECKLPRPFICEQNTKKNDSDPWSDGRVEIFDIEFILYHGRLTWAAAVSFCQQQGYALATVENMTVARKLAKAMLKSRPEFEDAWIGANYKDDEWNWVEDGEEVKVIPAQYKDPNRGDLPENIITPQFPPWFEPVPRKGRECVVFDRHLCDEPKFIDLKCNRQRDFICIKREKKDIKEQETQIVDRARKRYIFFPVSATWDEAKKICDDVSEDATMLNLTDADETRFIMQAMSDARIPLNHLWLGGKIVNNEWVWVSRDLESGEHKAIPTVPDDTGFPPWCDNETSLEMSCLNLDRQNHWTPLMYGLECNSTQAVVCVRPISSSDRIVSYPGVEPLDPPVKLRVTKLSKDTPLSWDDADKVCKKEVGKLWRPRFDLNESVPVISAFAKEVKNGQDTSRAVEVYHVDGGIYSAKRNAWIQHGKAVTIPTAGWEPHDGDCLVGQIASDGTEWQWYAVKCHHRLYSQIICQPYCSLTEVSYEDENSEWLCDASPSSIFDHKMTGMGCNHRCREQFVSQGPDRYYCDQKAGWHSLQARVPVTASECKTLENGLDAFKNIPEEIATLAFVIDSTSGSPADYNATKYLIGNLVDYYRSHVQSITVYVVSIEMNVNTSTNAVIKLTGYAAAKDKDCATLRKDILDPLVDTGEGARDYAAGLGEVRAALADTSLGEANIVFVVPEANQKGIFKDKAEELNQEARVFAIGTNKHAPVNQLVDVASQQAGENFAIQFKKPPDLITSVKHLISADCTECKCKDAFEDLVVHDKLQSQNPSEADSKGDSPAEAAKPPEENKAETENKPEAEQKPPETTK